MKKAELMDLMKNVGDEDDILMVVDGGDYWGTYLADFTIDLTGTCHEANMVGHPGAPSMQKPTTGPVVIIYPKD